MKIVVIDGMGGGIGCAAITLLRKELPGAEIIAAGTNAIATSAMLKAGADGGATGENAVIYNCADADYIVGVIGIVFANSMHGEVSPRMAEAVSASRGRKLLIPFDKCNATVMGVAERTAQAYIAELPKHIGMTRSV